MIDQASGNSGLVRVMHVLHGSLMVPGWGRPIVGWVGVFMFVSCLTGIWLWWPLSGAFASGFRWRRRNTLNANLHHLAGFWILIPLAMLSFTGAWITFPKVFGRSRPRPAAESRRPRAGDARAGRCERPRPASTPRSPPPGRYATGDLVSIGWPTDQKAGMEDRLRARRAAPAEVIVADGDRQGDAAASRRSPKRSPEPCAAGTTAPAWARSGRS